MIAGKLVESINVLRESYIGKITLIYMYVVSMSTAVYAFTSIHVVSMSSGVCACTSNASRWCARVRNVVEVCIGKNGLKYGHSFIFYCFLICKKIKKFAIIELRLSVT